MRISVFIYEYVYAYMNVRMMRAYERAGAHALICATQNWYESVVNLTALSRARRCADDVTWVHTAFSTFLQLNEAF